MYNQDKQHDLNFNQDPNNSSKAAGYETNPCAFMKLPRCMRQDASKRLDLSICQACISGRIEGHIFAIKEHVVPKAGPRGNV